MATLEIPPGKVQHIWCSAGITKKLEDVLIGLVVNQAQDKKGISEYVVYLSTLGGDPFSAINLYNFFKSISQKTTVWNMGSIASAGIPFFLGFETRYGVPDCSFMLHQTWISRTQLPESVNLFELENQKSRLAATDEKTQRLILKETASKASKALTKKTVEQAFLRSRTFSAPEAQTHGFIEKIEMPNIPTAETIYITDQYLATLPG